MDLSKITDQKLIKRINEIASKDGGRNPKEIDNPKGFQDLSILLSKGFCGRNLTTDERDVIMGLCIEYQSETGSRNTAFEGDNITVSGNGNNTTGRISNSNVVVGNNNQIIINNIAADKPNQCKHKISSASKAAGAASAKLLFDETVNSIYAYNDEIVNITHGINSKTAYSFFKEYQKLSNGKANIIQDIYKISDLFNRITLDETHHIIKSLLSQANTIGLKNSDAYKDLEKYSENIGNKRNKDPTKKESVLLDYAIQNLMDEMSNVYGDKN